ncbi:UDP-N-acetylglucosamine transferase subunit ALG13 [Palleronia marisminoris]|uniref:Glycosyl transferase family 28 C-terminal domain-containing protein n=1 Tax=Palleronia marisminoris TaxID=315423 RepID=A0A1Y5TRU1_9RHOB|nr:UDP-N-acetylglucosamine transferase subunit ALG13 [Palleronia marisminoris]SLN70383.1 hypothetical protein PAM7066_03572 [Palleronia marisminoris]
MIFLTLGTQLPFDRLVRALDEVSTSLSEPVFGQIGHAKYRPGNFESVKFLSPQEFDAHCTAARVIVGHAGIGTILTGMELHKPVVLMARQAALGEHRNNHQLATVAQLSRISGIHVVDDAKSLREALADPELAPITMESSPARDQLVASLRQEITGHAY